MATITNRIVSERLNEYAGILEQQGANQFRIRAYQRAAATVDNLGEEVAELFRRGGLDALVALPNVGRGIASAIAELVHTGSLTRLEQLRGSLEPSRLFQTVPGIGPKLAERIHDELDIDTLPELEMAAHDGRLENVEGFSGRRIQMVRAALQNVLATTRPAARPDRSKGPDVSLLLDMDRKYRTKADRGELPTIAPKRFNPGRVAWLPIMHDQVGDWHFTVLFSNTARAHELNRTRDWVVIYFYDDYHQEGQHTVVTETSGPLKGKRVVRGREAECKALHP
jgi:hypothetical protein